MKKNIKPTSFRTAKFCIQTVKYQDVIAFHVRVYMFYATGIILLLWLAGKIGTVAAFGGLIIGGLSVSVLMAMLIMARKNALLAIEDPKLREEAHQAMILYLSRKRLSKKEKRLIFNHRKTCHCQYCR